MPARRYRPVTTRRRFLITLNAGVLGTPRVSFAQQPSKVARIGYLYFGSRQSSLDTGRYNAFVQGMRELGYVEGTNLIIEARFADGKTERLPALAAELVRLKVDVIVATSTPVYRALQYATTTVPVVITLSFDPVGDGFAASLARPGGNMTGLSLSAADLGPKLLELLKAAVPKLSRVAVLLQPGNPAHPQRVIRIMSAAQKGGMQVVLAEAGTAQEIESRIRHDDEATRPCRHHPGRWILPVGVAPDRGADAQTSVAVDKPAPRPRRGW